MMANMFQRLRRCWQNACGCCLATNILASPSTSTLEDEGRNSAHKRKTIIIEIELHKVELHDISAKDSRGKEKVLFERQDLPQAAPSEPACISRDQEMRQDLRQQVSQRRETEQIARLQDHSFGNGLAALLDMYDLSKITPAMEEPIESMLIDLSIFHWMATLETQDDLSEVEKKSLEAAFGLTLRSLLRQSPTTEQFIFILKHLVPYGRLFLPVLNQLLYCGNHHPRIHLEVQQAFPDVPREIYQAGTTYENINEGDLDVDEL